VCLKFASSLTLINWLTVNVGFMLSIKILLVFFIVFWQAEDEQSSLHFHLFCYLMQMILVILHLMFPLGFLKVVIEELSLHCD